MLDMMERAQEMFVKEPALLGETPVSMFEMTLRQLQVGDAIDHQDFLDRVDTLGALGKPVLISNFLRYHRLVTYLSRHTQKPSACPSAWCGCVMCWMKSFYTDLPGGLMESLGQLFKTAAKMYVYPSLDKKTGRLTTVQNLEVAPHLRPPLPAPRGQPVHRGHHQLQCRSPQDLFRRSPGQIHSGDESVARLIPPAIVEVIKAKKLFGWQKSLTPKA